MPETEERYYREVDAQGEGGRNCISRIEYRVLRRTEKGAWIVPSWDHEGRFPKFVLDGAGRRFAYPTPEAARESYIQRKRREVQHCARQHDKAVELLAAAQAGAPPMPEFFTFVDAKASCEHCGCKLATVFGGLEYHAGDCPNLPL